MVEPSFLALTTTPSIGPSSAEATWPASAAAPWAAAGEPQAASTRVDANAAVTTKARRRNCIAASLDSTCAIARRGQARGSAKLPEPRTAPAWRQALPAVWDVDLHLLPPRSRRRCAICCWPQNSAQPRTVASYLSSWMLGAVLARERKLGRGELGMRALLSQRLEALLGLVFQMFQAGSRRQFAGATRRTTGITTHGEPSFRMRPASASLGQEVRLCRLAIRRAEPFTRTVGRRCGRRQDSESGGGDASVTPSSPICLHGGCGGRDSFQESQRRQQPLFLRDVFLEVARERRAVAVIVARLEGTLGEPDIGLALRRGLASAAELALDVRRQPGRPDQRAEAQGRDVEALLLHGWHVGDRGIANGGEQAGHPQPAGGGGGQRHRGEVDLSGMGHLYRFRRA